MPIKLVFRNLLSNPIRTVLTLSAIIISITALTLFLALQNGIRQFIFSNATAQNPLTQLVVRPKGQIAGYLNPINNLQPQLIDQQSIDRISRLENVVAVYPQNSLRGISTAQINLLDNWFQTDVLIFGLPKNIFEAESAELDLSDWDQQQYQLFQDEIPVVLSKQLLDIYNLSFASINNLPKLSQENLQGARLKLNLNQSGFFRTSNQQDLPDINARIIGFSNRAKLIGITLPLNAVKQIKTEILQSPPDQYLNLYIEASSVEAVPSLRNRLSSLGFDTYTSQENLNTISNYFNFFILSLSIIIVTILILTALLIANTFFTNLSERKREIGILRTLGSTTAAIKKYFLTEAALLGLIGSLIAIIMALLLASLAELYLQNLIQDFNLQPEAFFIFSPAHLIAIILFSSIFSSLCAVIPAVRASKIEPAISAE